MFIKKVKDRIDDKKERLYSPVIQIGIEVKNFLIR